jgi:hypothetical protein
MEARIAGTLGLKDASAKALAAAGSFKFDETSQRLFDDILMQRRQLNDASKSLNSARSKASKADEQDSPVLQPQILKRLMNHQTWLKQVITLFLWRIYSIFLAHFQRRLASSSNSESLEMPNFYCFKLLIRCTKLSSKALAL